MGLLGIPAFNEKVPVPKESVILSVKAHKRVENDKGIVNIENDIETLMVS